MATMHTQPKFKRAYFVAELEDGTKYEWEVEKPSYVTFSMSVPHDWSIHEVPVDVLVFPPRLSCFEVTARAEGAKMITVTQTDVKREDR